MGLSLIGSALPYGTGCHPLVRTGRKHERPLAVEILGRCRAAEAAELLVEQIDCPPPPFGSFPDPFGYYPAAKALLNIGEPGMQAIFTKGLDGPVSDRHLKIFAYVIWYYYRPMEEHELGLYRMQRLLEREKQRTKEDHKRYGEARPSDREKNLTRLIEVYKNIRPEDPSDEPRRERASSDGGAKP